MKTQIVNIPNKIDIQTVQVGDRVRFGRAEGTVKSIGSFGVNGYGVILWDDGREVESAIRCWKNLQKA
jgi:hypothetical protein